MTQGERIKKIRKELGFTLEKFGNILGVTKTAISLIENDKNNLTDANAKAICREFNVNEEWLRTGKGEMFVQKTRSQAIAEFLNVSTNEPDSFKVRFIEGMAKLSERDWEDIGRIVSILANKEENTNISPCMADDDLKSDDLFRDIPKTEEELITRFPPVNVNDETKTK